MLKVYLLHLDQTRTIFYSEEPERGAAEESDATVPPPGDARGWVEHKFQSLQTKLNESEQGIGLRMRRVWEWLHRRTSPEEVLLRRLRNVSSVELFHPATLTAERAREMWSDYLARRQRYHRIWLTANLLTTPVTLLLAPIPGPNIIGYWFLYRAICHVLALLGIQRVRAGGDLSTMIFHASAALDEPLAGSHAEHIARIAANFGLTGLEDYLTRVAAKGVGARDTPLAVP